MELPHFGVLERAQEFVKRAFLLQIDLDPARRAGFAGPA